MSDHRPRKTGKREILLAAVILSAAFLGFLWNRYFFSSPAAVVEISIDGNLTETLDLSVDQERTIVSSTGGSNHLIIRDGEVWVSQATCPDQICVRQGKISHDGEQIVCLPNRMIARITGE